jgi:S-adenosylmethionine:tRNA ribosyltransferase-isomerase
MYWQMKISEFDFNLPEELIAQEALPDRSASKLLVMDRATGRINHAHTRDLVNILRPGDLLVVNNSRVMPARLLGRADVGVSAECFLLKRLSGNSWEALVKPGKRMEVGTKITCTRDNETIFAEIIKKLADGKVVLKLSGYKHIDELLDVVGHVPLPPYIKRDDSQIDKMRYQTVYAKNPGSVAAPTAGLHFTPELIVGLKEKGIGFAEVTLHVGYGTFKPVRAEQVEDHTVDPEVYEVTPEAAEKINSAMQEGRRVIAVGTTSTRTIEGIAKANGGKIIAGTGTVDLFIYPGFQFHVISGLLTNFHLPQSSLLLLVSAFAGRENALQAYNVAIKEKYRFYSYGDAMLVI